VKVQIEVLATKTVDYKVTKEIDVPAAVVKEDRLYEWLDEEENHKIWQDATVDELEETDHSHELNEAYVLE
jgi:hypothetical protein